MDIFVFAILMCIHSRIISHGCRLGNRSTVKKSLVGANDYRQRSKFSSFQIKAFMCNHDRDKRFRESVDESIDIDLPIMI